MKTVTHNGMVYQIGAGYEFSDLGSSWHADDLEEINFTNGVHFMTSDSAWRKCRPIRVSGLGTITAAPIELEDGEVYQFDFNHGNKPITEMKGIRSIADCGSTMLGTFHGELYNVEYCTSIVKLVPEKSK